MKDISARTKTDIAGDSISKFPSAQKCQLHLKEHPLRVINSDGGDIKKDDSRPLASSRLPWMESSLYLLSCKCSRQGSHCCASSLSLTRHALFCQGPFDQHTSHRPFTVNFSGSATFKQPKEDKKMVCVHVGKLYQEYHQKQNFLFFGS